LLSCAGGGIAKHAPCCGDLDHIGTIFDLVSYGPAAIIGPVTNARMGGDKTRFKTIGIAVAP